MGEMSARDSDMLDESCYAYIAPDGGRHLPVHDAGHVRAALDGWNQTPFHSAHAKEKARQIIVHAASVTGVPLPEGDSAREAA